MRKNNLVRFFLGGGGERDGGGLDSTLIARCHVVYYLKDTGWVVLLERCIIG